MGVFGIYFIVLTFLTASYFVIMIAMDIYGKKGKKEDTIEEFQTADMSEEAVSDRPTDVIETSSGWEVHSTTERVVADDHSDEGDNALRSLVSPENEIKITADALATMTDNVHQTVIADAQRPLESICPEYQSQKLSTEMLAEMRQPIEQVTRSRRVVINL